MEPREAARAAIDHIRDRLVEPVAAEVERFVLSVAWRWRNDALALAHFARATLDAEIVAQIDSLTRLSGHLWRLLNEHAEALEEIADYKTARRFGASSELVAFGEEYLSGEDTSLREMLINALGFYLSWQSNTVWVTAGEKSHAAVARSYLPEIQDELWEFLEMASAAPADAMTMDRARDIASRAEKVTELVSNSAMPTNAQVALLAFLYHSMMRLRLGKLLIALESMADGG